MRLVLLALLFVSLGVSADLPVIDLYPIVMGFTDASLEMGTDQTIWLESRTFTIDLSEVTIPDDHLWEVSVFSDKTAYGSQACKYTVGYHLNGNPHVIREGAFGSDFLTWPADIFQVTSSVLWVRGSEVPNDSTHVFYNIENCDIGRYVVRSKYEAWNGQAYLMDWSGSTHIRTGWADQTTRLGSFDEVAGDGTFALPRDSSMFDPASGYWTEDFYFDYTPFMNLTRPILELWYYKDMVDSSNTLYFEFCDYNYYNRNNDPPTPADPDCTDPEDYDWYNTQLYTEYDHLESGFVRVFFDIKKSISIGGYAEDPFHTVYVNIGFGAAMAPYAKIWDFRTTDPVRLTGSPQLLDLTSSHAAYTGDCYYDDYSTDGSYSSIEYTGPGFHVWSCASDDGATVTWTLPASVSSLQNPWMAWYEYNEDSVYYQYDYTVTEQASGKVIHRTTSLPSSSVNGDYSPGYGVDRYLGLPKAKYNGGERFVATQTSQAMMFSGVIPIYSGGLDYCAMENPCMNEGKCYTYYYGTQCVCPIGWEGPTCEVSSDDCWDSSCLNGGTCVDGDQTYTCECTEDYEGHRCEKLVNNCPMDECLNGGMCVAGADGKWSCDCSGTGHSGLFCEHDDNNCNLDPYACKNGAECVSAGDFTYTCKCVGGFTGQWCEITPECSPNPCMHGGECSTVDGEAACTCTANYFGPTCEERLWEFEEDCRYGTCHNGGLCKENADGDFRCACDITKWTGLWCEVSTRCDTDGTPTCMNGGSCEIVNNNVVCSCSANYFGDFCENTLAEHMLDCRYSGVCQNSGRCRDDAERGTFRCVCASGWTGDWCEETTKCTPNPCKNDGACSLVNGKATCTCTGNYFGDLCEDKLNSYERDCRYSGPCENGGVCNDNAKKGEFRCVCDSLLWKGDFCEISKLCEQSPCENGGRCVVVNGAPLCYCAANYFGDHCQLDLSDFAKDCRFAGECANGVCNDNAEAGKFRCVCPSGWMGDWCEQSALCENNPCQHGGECYTVNGGIRCNCPGSYFGDFCQDTLEDFSKDCRFAGQCENDGVCNDNRVKGVYRCVCPTGWTGDWCEVSTLCEVNPCDNGGECFVAGGRAMCQCPGNYYGVTCQNSLEDYFGDCGSPCMNGGTCNSIVGVGFKCACDPNWTGPYCETPVVCNGANNPCKNNGACRRGADGKAFCVCPGDYSGVYCETALMEFFQTTFLQLTADCRFGSPCDHGTCSANVAGAFRCVCENGYFGTQCETPTACSPNPCQNDGLCDVVDGDVVCYCPAGTIGDRCQWTDEEFLVPDCRFVPCENGGTCNLDDKSYVCNCAEDWSGDWCELSAHCDPNPCENGGSCFFDGTNPVCFCEGDFFGPTCSFENLGGRVVEVEAQVDHLNRVNNVPTKN